MLNMHVGEIRKEYKDLMGGEKMPTAGSAVICFGMRRLFNNYSVEAVKNANSL
jgi:hypothetical protein